MTNGIESMSTPVKFVGFPDGPKTFVKELGQEVGTFPKMDKKTLTWHVPLDKRGFYRATDLANYSPENDYRTTPEGYVLCYGITKAGSRCEKKAQNRWPRCEFHGGALHPLDKLVKESEEGSNDEAIRESLTRFQEFKAGYITVDDLDDEELATGGFRSKKNGTIYRPKNVPRELANAFQRAIYERANEELRSLTVDAARTIGEIFKNRNNEPDIRLKGAFGVLERTLGKPATNVVVSQDKPFEHVFSDLEVGSREQFRNSNRDIVIDGATGRVEQGSQPFEVDSDPFGIGVASSTKDDDLSEELPNPLREHAIGEGPDELSAGSVRDGLFVRNEAILAQFAERKPFEYDLADNSENIKKATKRRYASRALGVDLSGPQIPYLVDVRRTKTGTFIRYVDPETKVVATKANSADTRRKSYTLSDF